MVGETNFKGNGTAGGIDSGSDHFPAQKSPGDSLPVRGRLDPVFRVWLRTGAAGRCACEPAAGQPRLRLADLAGAIAREVARTGCLILVAMGVVEGRGRRLPGSGAGQGHQIYPERPAHGATDGGLDRVGLVSHPGRVHLRNAAKAGSLLVGA